MPLERVYYFPVDAMGEEGEPVEVALSPEGVADISTLPAALQSLLRGWGMKGPGETVFYRAEDGARFLQALLDGSNPYRRFRTTAEKI